MKPLILDTAAMMEIDLSGLKLIEASAGTGKTYTIANFYLRHILAGKMPSEILVVTFTNAATEELRGRVRLRLYQAQQVLMNRQDSDDEFLTALKVQFEILDKAQQNHQLFRLKHALRWMDEAAISTIHSFCQRVLQDYALPSFQFFESELLVDDDTLWHAAIRDWWRQTTYRLDRSEWLLLNDATGGFDPFVNQLNEIKNKASTKLIPQTLASLEQIFLSQNSLAPELKKISKSWLQNKEGLINTIRQSKALSRSKQLPYHPEKIDYFLQTLDEYFCSEAIFPLPADFRFLSSDVLHENSKASKRGSDSNLDHQFFKSLAAIDNSIHQLHLLARPAALIEALEYCSQRVKSQKQANRTLSYQDQLDHTRQALLAEGGDALARSLRQQYPVAMIDEFQDTDRIQYDIFRLVYFNQEEVSLTLIGDPKQAIYSFRGGDIFTYMQARQEPEIQLCVLHTNWRSQPGLVNAVNHFFTYRNDPFIYSESIRYDSVSAAEINSRSVLTNGSKPEPAMTLWQIPADENGKPYSKDAARSVLNQAVAAEVVRLIRGGQQNKIQVAGNPLQSGNIAILVRSAFQGDAIRGALAEKGVASVTIGRDKVFDSEEATGLSSLLKAVAHCSDRNALRQALASQLLNLDHLQISSICSNETKWQNWLDQYQSLHQLWNSRGFIPMFQKLMQDLELGIKLSHRNQAERRLTNLLQLGELLQQQSLRSGGMDNLLNWFQQQRFQSASEESELRLESDRSLVNIVTIHKSKGLEYPVVFLPFLWDCKSIDARTSNSVSFHNGALESIVDLGSENFETHCLLADRERLAEDIRLLYVALTRARSKVYLAWGEAGSRSRPGNSSQTALAYLLHSKQTPEDLNRHYAHGIPNPETLSDELKMFVASSGGDIELSPLPVSANDEKLVVIKTPTTDLQARTFETHQSSAWRISSFSNLTRDIHQVAHLGSSKGQGDAIIDFPAGSHVGLMLHAIFEHLDFTDGIEGQCHDLIPGIASRFGFDFSDKQSLLVDWFEQMLHTPLHQPGLSLSVLTQQNRLNELAFDFALDHADIKKLNGWLATRSSQPVSALNAQDFRGLITGIIDLVFEYDGKYYLADYKSNFLGASLDDYRPDKLTRAMLDRRYDLQLLIYSIALHRYLRQRIANYDYATHFGGAYYLFLRAMRRDSGTEHGVYFECPPQSDIESLDKLLINTTTVTGS